MSNHQDIITEKKKILEFCENALKDKDGEYVERSFGGPDSPFRFILWFEDESSVIVNHVYTELEWRRRGLFSFLLTLLENSRNIKRVWLKSAMSEDILPIIKKRGYKWGPDNDYSKVICSDEEIFPLTDIPSWLGKVVTIFRRKDLDM